MFGRRKHESLQHSLVRAVQERDDALEAAAARDAHINDLQDNLLDLHRRLDEREAMITSIRASLSEVAVYEGMDLAGDSLLLYVNELVRDHEELERRIDHAMLELRAASAEGSPHASLIARILNGSMKTPDGIDG